MKLSRKTPPEVQRRSQNRRALALADTVAAHLTIKIADKQALLETLTCRSAWKKCLR